MTSISKQPVRLSGVFLDASGVTKGLTVLRVLGDVEPHEGWAFNLANFPQKVTSETGALIGTLDLFWWQNASLADTGARLPVNWTGGAMTCLVALNEDVLPAEQCWQDINAQIAEPGHLIGKPVRLTGGEEIGILLDELTYLRYAGHTVYPLLKVLRSETDRNRPSGIRNGAMVFAADGSMVGVIVASFGGGSFYSVVPINDIMNWHSLAFLPAWAFLPCERPSRFDDMPRPIPHSSQSVLDLVGT
jgi:hypothetical protein